MGIHECKEVCEITQTCTAFNYNNKLGRCAILACPLPVMAPDYQLSGFEGYNIIKGIINNGRLNAKKILTDIKII